MRAPMACLLMLATLTAGCAVPPGLPGTESLARPWLIGIEPMANDPPPVLPWTNRFLAALAAMPNTRVVFLGAPDNAFLFEAERGDKVRVVPALRADRACMALTYTIVRAGQAQGVFGLLVPALPAGREPASLCVDRAARDFYQALAVQGL